MPDKIVFEDAGDSLTFHLPLGEQLIPVRIMREAMEANFGAAPGISLADTYREHAEQMHERISSLVDQRATYTEDSPLVVREADLD